MMKTLATAVLVAAACCAPLWAQEALPAADEIAVRELLARMSWAVDEEDYAAYAGFYTEDGEYQTSFAGGATGREGIAAWLEQNRAGIAGKRHVIANLIVNGSGDTATARAYLVVIEREGPPEVQATATFEDELVKVEGEWRVARHEVTVDPGMMRALEATEEAQEGSSTGQ